MHQSSSNLPSTTREFDNSVCSIQYKWEIFDGVKFHRIASRSFRGNFQFQIFVEQMGNAWTTPYQLIATPHTWTPELNSKKWRSKLVQQQLSFFLCSGHVVNESIGLPPWAKNWLVEQKESVLLISTSTASQHLLVTGWFCSTVAIWADRL